MKYLELRTFLAFLALVFVLVGTHGKLSAQGERDDQQERKLPVVRKGLLLSTELVGERFKQDGILKLRVKLENTGDKPICIHKQLGFGAGGFRLTITDDKGRWIPPRFARDTFPAPVQSKADLQTIQPEKSIEQEITIDLSDYAVTPGDYVLMLKYISPVPVDAVTGDIRALTSDDGALEAKPIRFKVVE